MSFPSDTSTQLNNPLSISDNYTSATTPNINFNATSGIYNPSANVIKIYTNNIDALTINASQQLSGNGTGLTNLNYSAITNLPIFFKLIGIQQYQINQQIFKLIGIQQY